MAQIQTYVYFDLETSGLPSQECNKTKITEISFVAIKRQHLLDCTNGATPRVQHKLTLCINPRRPISDESSKITGLDNDLLEFEPPFDMKVFTVIDTFLGMLTPPVCLVAHNGYKFDYPILQNHLVKLGVKFSTNILCTDCFHTFYHILESKELETQPDNTICNSSYSNADSVDSTFNPSSTETPLASTITSDSCKWNADSGDSTVIKETQMTCTVDSVDELDLSTPNVSMQALNETTPKTQRIPANPPRVGKARKQLFPWGDGVRPKHSYKLTKIYERVFKKPAVEAHRAENDCMLALEISVGLAKKYVEWVDNNHQKFSEIKPMTVGVPM